MNTQKKLECAKIKNNSIQKKIEQINEYLDNAKQFTLTFQTNQLALF